jgi:hypothetical protein
MRQRRRVTQAIRSGPLVAGRRRSWFSHFCVGRSVDADGVFSMCVCVSFLFLECPFFLLMGNACASPGWTHNRKKRANLYSSFFSYSLKAIIGRTAGHTRNPIGEMALCVFHYPRDQIASSSATGGGRFFFSCFLVLFGRKDFFFFRL